jgi:hypothetical protein
MRRGFFAFGKQVRGRGVTVRRERRGPRGDLRIGVPPQERVRKDVPQRRSVGRTDKERRRRR